MIRRAALLAALFPFSGIAAMSNPPSADRPPPPQVPAIEQDGTIYEQDSGHGHGGWLLARDAASGRKRWEIEVFHVDPPSPDAPALDPTGYFGSMALTGPSEITITREYRPEIRYRVDLLDRIVRQEGDALPLITCPVAKPKPRLYARGHPRRGAGFRSEAKQ